MGGMGTPLLSRDAADAGVFVCTGGIARVAGGLGRVEREKPCPFARSLAPSTCVWFYVGLGEGRVGWD